MTFFSCHWLLSPEFVMSYLLQLEPTGTELLPIGHSLGAGSKDGEMKAASHSTSTAGAGRATLNGVTHLGNHRNRSSTSVSPASSAPLPPTSPDNSALPQIFSLIHISLHPAFLMKLARSDCCCGHSRELASLEFL